MAGRKLGPEVLRFKRCWSPAGCEPTSCLKRRAQRKPNFPTFKVVEIPLNSSVIVFNLSLRSHSITRYIEKTPRMILIKLLSSFNRRGPGIIKGHP